VFAWGIPTSALIVATLAPASVRTIVWTVALAWMGIACIANALRCGRLHCNLTGPFFVLMAIVTALYGSGHMPLGPSGWLWLGVTLVVGAGGLLWYLPERIFGRYAGGELPR